MNAISPLRALTDPIGVVGISGSPSSRSRSAWLLDLAQSRLIEADPSLRITPIRLRELSAVALLSADDKHSQLRAAIDRVAAARIVLVATPIYKAAYSGLLKLFLDILPIDALRGKAVVPIVTGGSAAHLLALEYAIKPVLSTLGARDILDGVFATDAELTPDDELGFIPEAAVHRRLDQLLRGILERLPPAVEAFRPLARCS